MNDQLSKNDIMFLMLRYHSIKHYIFTCFSNGDTEELVDFIFALEFDDEPKYN